MILRRLGGYNVVTMSEKTITKKTLTRDFTEGRMLPMLISFMLPFLLANLLNSIYTTVDTIIIGHFEAGAGIVAVNMGSKMLDMATLFGTALASGGQIFIGQLVGAKKKDQLNSTIGTLFTLTFVASLFFAVIAFTFGRTILTWLNTPKEAFEGALAYLRITVCGLPLIYGYNAVSSVLRGMGDSKHPLLFIAIAAVSNLIGDVVLIVFFDLGVVGTAIATVFGQGLSLILSLIILYRRKEEFHFDFKRQSFKVDWKKLGIIVKLGLPLAICTFAIKITQTILMGYVNLYGVVESAAYSIGDRFFHLANIFSISVRTAGGTIVSQNIGADKPERVRLLVRCSMLITFFTSLALSALSWFWPEFVYGLFTSDAAVVAMAEPFMHVCVITFGMAFLSSGFSSVVTGTGASTLSMIGGLLDGVIFRVGLSVLFTRVFGMGVLGFFLADSLARVAMFAVEFIYYVSGAWKRHKKLV